MLEFVEFLIIVEVVEDVEMAVIPISISIVMAATFVSFYIGCYGNRCSYE